MKRKQKIEDNYQSLTEAEEYAAAVVGIRKGLAAPRAGRVLPANEFFESFFKQHDRK